MKKKPKKKLAMVRFGVTAKDMPVAGKNIEEIRKAFKKHDSLVMDAERVGALVNGIPVEDAYVVKPEDRVDFLLKYGIKEFAHLPPNAGSGKTMSMEKIHEKIGELFKPDPVALGEELAEYIRRKWSFNKPPDCPAAIEVMELAWERDFWRDKVLNP